MPQLTQNNNQEQSMDIDPVQPTGSVPGAPTNDPLNTDSGMLGALDEIRTGAPGSRTDTTVRDIRAEIGLKMKASAEKAKQLEAQKNTAEAGSSKRPREATSPIGSNKKSKTPGGKASSKPTGATDDAMNIDKPVRPQVDFGSMIHDIRPVPCAIRFAKQKLIGDPTTLGSTPGMTIKLRLDAGKTALPSIGLDFRFSKTGVNSANEDDYHHFTVGWEPGVKVADNWMMEDLQFRHSNDPERKEFHFPQEVRRLVKTQDEQKRLVCATFRSNAHKSSLYDSSWPDKLQQPAAENVSNNLEAMVNEVGKYYMTIWFLVPSVAFDYFDKGCLSPLTYAVEKHLPPNHIYTDEHGEPLINYDIPSIKAMGDGMYCRYPLIKQSDGTRIPNKDAKPSFIALPRKITWDTLKHFYIYYGVSNVREHQFNIGMNSRLARDWHQVYLERVPVWSVDGKDLTPDDTLFRNSFYAGVRMTRDKDGAKDTPPTHGSIIKCDFYNGAVSEREHEVIKQNIWYGRVEPRTKAWLDATGTDFCVLLTKPRRAPSKISARYDETEYIEDGHLHLAKIEVKVDPTAAKRELIALGKFCDEKFDPELLDEIRLAFVSDPSRANPPQFADLTWGPKHNRSKENHDKWEAMMAAHEKQRGDNPSQMNVLRSASSMRSNIVAVGGPPGAGKTRTLRDKCISLVKIGHKVLCVAAANVAVDTDANAIWGGLTREEQKKFKCLRLEGGAAEKAAMLAKINYAAYENKEGEEDVLPEYVDEKTAQDNPLMRNTLEKIASDFAVRQNQIQKLMAEYDDVDKVYKLLQQDRRLKRSNVPVGMTLDYRIWQLTEEDRLAAIEDYAKARAAMDPKEFDKQLLEGKISQDHFDKSAVYRRSVAEYIKKNGKVTGAERQQLEDASDAIITRVLKETTILFTTCSNAGGKLLEDGNSFQPSVIFCDEAGQLSMASLCVPLTVFRGWEGLYLFGDVSQLMPTVLSGGFNEFIHNARISPLALLEMKGFPKYDLDTQYRMSPAISAFPNKQFYNGILKNHPKSENDNATRTREKMRQISIRLGAKGFKKRGSEYFLIDVKHGVSRIEANGTSLVNHANADRILALIRDMLSTGITPGEIKVLTYYQGQRRHMLKTIHEAEGLSDEQKGKIQVHTVDSYQGKESSVIILDIVTARDLLRYKGRRNFDVAEQVEDDMDNGTEAYIKLGTVTGQVKSGNRLNVALTRAMNGLVVVCQEALLVGNPKTTKNRGKGFNAIKNMCEDARHRSRYVADGQTEQESREAGERLTAAVSRKGQEVQALFEQKWTSREAEWRVNFDAECNKRVNAIALDSQNSLKKHLQAATQRAIKIERRLDNLEGELKDTRDLANSIYEGAKEQYNRAEAAKEYPISVEIRSKWKVKDIENIRQEQADRDFSFIKELKELSRDLMAQKPHSSMKVPRYRTAKGHTTRPIAQDPPVVIAADERSACPAIGRHP